MEHFSLRWNNYLSEVTDAYHSLRNDEELVDVTISCEGRKLKAHKVLLSACSSYFREIFKENPCQHPVIVFRNVQFIDLEAILDYIYKGEVSVVQSQLESFLDVAQLLEVKGLSEGSEKEDEEDTVLKHAGTSEAEVACAQPLNARKPPLKKRKLSTYKNVAKPPSREQNPGLKLKMEPDEDMEDDALFDDDTQSTNDDNTELKFDIPSQHSPARVPLDNVHIQEPADPTEKPPQDKATTSVEADNETTNDNIKEVEVKKNVQDEENLSKCNAQPQPLKSAVPSKPQQRTEPSKMPAQETSVSSMASKKIKLDVESKEATKEPNLQTPAVKSAVTKGNVHIPKGLTVTLLPVNEQLNIKLSDSYIAQPSDEDSVLRSEHARTPVGEESQPQEVVGFTATDHIQQGESEMAEEAPQIESEQATAEEPQPEEPEFDYYGCEICKTEAKAYDRLSFTHKCPICPCMCFCSHLLKDHMRFIHGWFNVQRKFTQNY